MIIFKPNWITHSDRAKGVKPCIYSIHVHPDGKRIATGGLDATVKIWSTESLFNESEENNPDTHQLLCTMQRHSGAVLCVRWSNEDGRYLASSSDNDNVIIVWELDRDATSETVFGSTVVNHEPWRPVKYLRAHESDVQDLAWSKDNQYLASCGVDGVVVVWNGTDFNQVQKIDQHAGFVKGVAWDPVGKYLACQSDDKMLKIWRTSDWGLEQEIKAPFINAPGTTLFRRLSWSPNGSHIVTSNAVNGVHCIAAIISREDWGTDVSLVGHQLPIEVACFNPKLFYFPNEEDGNTNNGNDSQDTGESLATVCALAGQDRGVSLWVTKYCRPVCVATDIFEGNIYDLAWTPDGKALLACSHDGTVACLRMDEILLNCASDDEIVEELTKYGYKGTNGMTGNNGVYPESIGQLEREEQNATASRNQRIQDLMGPSSATTTNTITQLPILLTSNTDDHQSNEGTTVTTATLSNKVEQNNSNNINNNHVPVPSSSQPSPPTIPNGRDVETANEGLNTFTTLSKNNIQSQPANSDITSASSSKSDTIVQQTVTIGKDGKRRIKPVTIRTKSSVASRSNSVSQGSSQPRTLLQDDNRPTAMIMSGNDATIIYDFPSAIIPNTGIRATAVGTKRPSGSETAMDVDEIERHRKRPIWMDSAMLPPASSKSKIRLGVPKVKSTFIRPVRDEATKAVMECDNPARADVSDDESDNEQQCARLTVTSKGQTLWQDYLPSAIMLMTGNGRFSAVACEDASIHVYSTAGRRLLPPIVLESTAVLLHCSDQWLLCLTCTGLLYTWDIVNTSSCIDGVSIAPVLNVARLPESTDDDDQDETHDAPSIKDVRIQKNGIPLLITNYRQAFAFHLGMKVWMRISDAWYIISEFWNTGMGTPKDYPLGWLSTAMTLNTGLDPIGQTMLTLVEGRKEATNAITLSHLEIQIAVAALLESPVEYRDWLKQYARRLARENELEKIKELCRWLAGPPFISKDHASWEPTTLGTLSKHDLLREIMPILASNRQLQRTVDEFSEYIL